MLSIWTKLKFCRLVKSEHTCINVSDHHKSPSIFSVPGELWLCGFCGDNKLALNKPSLVLDLVCVPLFGECLILKSNTTEHNVSACL